MSVEEGKCNVEQLMEPDEAKYRQNGRNEMAQQSFWKWNDRALLTNIIHVI